MDYCNSLENCRVSKPRGFESHTLLHGMIKVDDFFAVTWLNKDTQETAHLGTQCNGSTPGSNPVSKSSNLLVLATGNPKAFEDTEPLVRKTEKGSLRLLPPNRRNAGVAQQVEHLTFNQVVLGSNPNTRTISLEERADAKCMSCQGGMRKCLQEGQS